MERSKIVKLVVSIALILFSMSVMPQAWAAAEGDMTVLRAAHRGDVNAMRRIGMRMYRGCSVGDRSTGIQWLEKAAGKGDAEAMYLLGLIYAAKKNSELSKVYLEKASKLGNEKAIAYLRKREKERVLAASNGESSKGGKGKVSGDKSSKPERKGSDGDELAGKTASPVPLPKDPPKGGISAPELHLVQQHSTQQQYTFPTQVPQNGTSLMN